jgi:hypothetical protein
MCGEPKPVRRAGPELVRLKCGMVDEAFVKAPDKGVIGRLDAEGQTARLCPTKPDMLGQVVADKRHIRGVVTGKRPGDVDHSSSIVPGGFEVQS